MADYEYEHEPRVNKTTVVAKPVSEDEASENHQSLESDHFTPAPKPKTVTDPNGKVIEIKMAPKDDPLAETAREAQVGFGQTAGRRR